MVVVPHILYPIGMFSSFRRPRFEEGRECSRELTLLLLVFFLLFSPQPVHHPLPILDISSPVTSLFSTTIHAFMPFSNLSLTVLTHRTLVSLVSSVSLSLPGLSILSFTSDSRTLSLSSFRSLFFPYTARSHLFSFVYTQSPLPLLFFLGFVSLCVTRPFLSTCAPSNISVHTPFDLSFLTRCSFRPDSFKGRKEERTREMEQGVEETTRRAALSLCHPPPEPTTKR